MADRVRLLTLCLALSMAGLAGCSKSSPSAAPSPTPSGAASASATTPTPSPTPSGAPLPGSCGELLPFLDLDQALGTPLLGRSEYIKGVPEPKIHRLGRVTCRYGIGSLPGERGKLARVELGVSVYTDEASAAKRIDVTTQDARTKGASARPVQVSGLPATVLLGPGLQELVLATGTRTLALSFGGGLVRGDPTKQLVAVATLAMKNLPQ